MSNNTSQKKIQRKYDAFIADQDKTHKELIEKIHTTDDRIEELKKESKKASCNVEDYKKITGELAELITEKEFYNRKADQRTVYPIGDAQKEIEELLVECHQNFIEKERKAKTLLSELLETIAEYNESARSHNILIIDLEQACGHEFHKRAKNFSSALPMNVTTPFSLNTYSASLE